MTCQRCGYCCIAYDVIIIHPNYIQKELVIDELPKEAFLHKEYNHICPFLEWNGDIAICRIHHFSWFEETPCASHNANQVCRLGKHLKENNPDLLESLKSKPRQKYSDIKI